jgi:hypothetical protein
MIEIKIPRLRRLLGGIPHGIERPLAISSKAVPDAQPDPGKNRQKRDDQQ